VDNLSDDIPVTCNRNDSLPINTALDPLLSRSHPFLSLSLSHSHSVSLTDWDRQKRYRREDSEPRVEEYGPFDLGFLDLLSCSSLLRSFSVVWLGDPVASLLSWLEIRAKHRRIGFVFWIQYSLTSPRLKSSFSFSVIFWFGLWEKVWKLSGIKYRILDFSYCLGFEELRFILSGTTVWIFLFSFFFC
jgi:hypothetical protein